MLLYVAVRAVLRHRRDHDRVATTTGSSTHGKLYELDAIAAVIIGGTLLSGGRGTIIGSILGVLVFTTITNIFILNNLATEVQNIAKGADHRRRRPAPEPRPARGHLSPSPPDPPSTKEGNDVRSVPNPSARLGRRGFLAGALASAPAPR